MKHGRIEGETQAALIFEPKKDENWKWSEFHNRELRSLYRLLNTVRMIKSKILRWPTGRGLNPRHFHKFKI